MEVVKTKDKTRLPTGWAEFGARVKSLREMHGISRDAVADCTSIDATSLWRIETGHQWVSPRALRELSTVLKVPVSELFVKKEAEKGSLPQEEEDAPPSLRRLLLTLASLNDSEIARYIALIEKDLAARRAGMLGELSPEPSDQAAKPGKAPRNPR